MAILTSLNILSEQRLDVSDMRRLESGVRNDFDTLITSTVTGTGQGYIIRGFSLVTTGAIGSPANGLQMTVDPGSVLHIDASVSGTIFQTPLGTPNQVLNAAANTNVNGSFTANSTNYVGIDYNRFADASTDVDKFIWNSAAKNEIVEIAPAAQTLTYKIIISTSPWAQNVLPVAIVTTDSNGNVLSITDARWMLYSLETGGISPNPNYVYPWTDGREQPPVTINSSNSSEDPFLGGDRQIDSLKSWMNAVMSEILEIKGTPYWFTGPSISPPVPIPPTLVSLFQDLGNTVITGSGEISNGILPNSTPILVTTGNITQGSNQLTSLASVAGLATGDFIFGTGITSGTTIGGISGSTITMSQIAAFSGTGIGFSFYSPSAITVPGQINWDESIQIRVIGSSLTYTLAANPTSTDISLTDDEVAYINLVRDVVIGPNIVFTGGSPVLTSVGAVAWTAPLLPGDYVKVAVDTVSGYYKILTVDSSSQVTLTSSVSIGDNSGPAGVKAEYAFGSYHTSPSPATSRDIRVSPRGSVPTGGNTFWLFMREDNGGSPRVYIRFLSEELDNGQSVQVSGTTSLELLQYIGSSGASDSRPLYSAALTPGAVPQISTFTLGSGATITGSQYFLIYSSANARQYVAWFKVDGVGSEPSVPNINSSIEIYILSTDTAAQVATKVASALNSTAAKDFHAVPTSNTVVSTNTSAGTANAASNADVSSPFTIVTTQSGTGSGNYIVKDGDNLTLAIKELDQAIGNIFAVINSPTYDEVIEIVASGATPPNSLNGPVANGTIITIPNNSREGNVPQQYTVGSGIISISLNGQFLDVESGAYAEVGATGSPSSQIQILTLPGGGLVVGDELEIRFSGSGGGAGAGGGVGPAGPAGPAGPPGADALGGPVSISTKNGPTTYAVLSSDCFLRGNCAGGVVNFNLPAASSVTGRAFYFKKIDASVNPMNVVAAGSDLIDGLNTQFENVQYESFSVISTGSGWDVF